VKLEKIVLNGFKSFADKTEFNFDYEITAIVGPNGCGKSNVVDAMKWVLGNQSPKSLRSGQMSDVIFSGSSSRKPSGMAEVSLYFTQVENLSIEQNDLTIARRLYKSGESEYVINGRTCRLKDIRELFMDTGIGVSAYSIIEQGQIDQLLHASKTDRRLIFEEAAGISKYKAHKNEAMRKLGRTEQNLLRLADIINEVARQLRSIKLQAGKARNYLKYSERLKELRVNYSLSEYHKITTKTKEKKEALAGLEQRFGEIVAEVAQRDAQLSGIGKSIIETEVEINRWDNSLISARSKIEQHMERIEYLRSRIDELTERKSSGTEQVRKLEKQNAEFVDELAESKSLQEENEKTFAEQNAGLTEMQHAVNEINSECLNIEASLDDEKSGIIDIVRRTAQLHNEIESIGTYRDNLNGQKNRLSGRADAVKQQLSQLLTEKAQYQAKLGDINKVIDDLQRSLDAKRQQMTDVEAVQVQRSESLAGAKEKRSGLVSEQNILSDMEAKHQGLSSSIKDILNAKSQEQSDGDKYDYIEGIIADVIRVDTEYASVIEAALEGMTDALVINDTEKFLADEQLQNKVKSRVKVICTDKIEPFVNTHDFSKYPAVIGRAVEFVSYDSKYAKLAWKLLGRVILVDSIDCAIELSAKLGSGYTFVTKEGQSFDGQLSICVGPVGKSAGLISRKSRLKHIGSEVASIAHQISQIETELEQNSRQSQHLGKLCKDLRTAVYEANTEKIDAESKLRLIEQNVQRLTEEQPVVAGEIEILERDISQSVQKEYESKQKLQELEEINSQRNAHIEQLEAELAEKKKVYQEKTASLTDIKIQLGTISEQKNSIQQKINSLGSQLQFGRNSTEAARGEILICDKQIAETKHDILVSESSVSELFLEKENSQKFSTEMHKKVDELLEQQKQNEELLKEKRSQQSQIEQQMHQLQLDIGQLAVKDEDLTERVREELGMDLAESYKNFQQEDIDWEQVQQEIAELREKIGRLGNVNVDAISQQDELQQRYEFLTRQVEDLDGSKSQLEQLIDKINKESKERFEVTFEQVKSNFQELFRKLFGGGKADIFLEDPNNILECGIEIVARPPGKETRSISLLSGGEKTLTALALLFAVFRCKPSPFCFLDEVDAALDEANNERFNMILREFKKDSQFIVVTHSKRTMSIADVLFGVTMQIKGVSKKISVQFDSVDADTEVAVA